MVYDALYSMVLYSIVYILPAYAANGAPVIFGAGKPIDAGKKIKGRRIFGDNKTRRGTISSIIAGMAVAALESVYIPYMLAVGVLLTIGANFGDLLGSFVKRRMGYGQGEPFPILDQYGFFAFAILFALPLGNIPTTYGLAFLVMLTGILHPLTNWLAHMLKLKRVPW